MSPSRWNHGWIAGTPFEAIDDLVLWDFGIHWFDFLSSLIGDRARRVAATATRAAGQKVRPPLLAEALVAFEGGQASLTFDGATHYGARDSTVVIGTSGVAAAEKFGARQSRHDQAVSGRAAVGPDRRTRRTLIEAVRPSHSRSFPRILRAFAERPRRDTLPPPGRLRAGQESAFIGSRRSRVARLATNSPLSRAIGPEPRCAPLAAHLDSSAVQVDSV
jgi:predicted dehydrogenase